MIDDVGSIAAICSFLLTFSIPLTFFCPMEAISHSFDIWRLTLLVSLSLNKQSVQRAVAPT